MAQVLGYLSKIKEQKAKGVSPQIGVNIYDFSRFKENPSLLTAPAKPVTPAVQPMTPRIASTPMTTPATAPTPTPTIQAPSGVNPDLLNQYMADTSISQQGRTKFKEYLDSGKIDKINLFLEGNYTPTTPTTPTPTDNLPGFDLGTQVGEGISNIGNVLKVDFTKGNPWLQNEGEGLSNITKSSLGAVWEGLKGGAEFAVNLPGDTIQAIGDLTKIVSNPVGTVKDLNTLGTAIVEGSLNKLTGQNVWTSEESKIVGQAIGEQLKTIGENPDMINQAITQNPFDVLTAVTGGLGTAKNLATKKGLTDLASKIETVQQATNPINALKLEGAVANKLTTKLSTPIQKAKTLVSEKISPVKNVDDILLQISQGEAKDLNKFKGALSQIDTKDVKTYDQLVQKFDNRIKEIVPKQDELFGANTQTFNINDLTTASKGGTKTINYVNKAFDDMIKLYDNTGDINNLERLEGLKSGGNLTIKQINDLAREYNNVFGKKAFKPDGTPKFSDVGQAYENIRTGLKNLARDKMPDEATKILDTELSNLYRAKELSENVVKKVDNLRKKFIDRGLMEQLSIKAGKAFNIATGNSIKGFMQSFFPSNVGLKVGNSLDIQNALANNLKQLETLLNNSDKLSNKNFMKQFLDITSKGLDKAPLKSASVIAIPNKNK